MASLNLGGAWSVWMVAGALFLGGCGCALFNSQITAAALCAVPAERSATASAICVTMRQIGFAFGIALLGALIQPDHQASYPLAFATAGLITLAFAAAAFVLLTRPATE
jgi:MFS family permease